MNVYDTSTENRLRLDTQTILGVAAANMEIQPTSQHCSNRHVKVTMNMVFQSEQTYSRYSEYETNQRSKLGHLRLIMPHIHVISMFAQVGQDDAVFLTATSHRQVADRSGCVSSRGGQRSVVSSIDVFHGLLEEVDEAIRQKLTWEHTTFSLESSTMTCFQTQLQCPD